MSVENDTEHDLRSEIKLIDLSKFMSEKKPIRKIVTKKNFKIIVALR